MSGEAALQKVRVNGTELAYVERGTGEPIVLVHGTLSDYRNWALQLDDFSNKYRVVAYSRRLHYPNSPQKSDTDYSALQHANDLGGLIEALKIAPSRVVGASYGAYVALNLAAEQPNKICSMALAEPPILPWLEYIPGGSPYYAEFKKNAWYSARRAFDNNSPEEGVKCFIDSVNGHAVFDSLSPSAKEKLMDNAPELSAETRSSQYFSTFSCADAGRIFAPTLILRGESSPDMFRLINDELANCLSNAEQTVIPHASHAMSSHNPNDFNLRVLSFFESH